MRFKIFLPDVRVRMLPDQIAGERLAFFFQCLMPFVFHCSTHQIADHAVEGFHLVRGGKLQLRIGGIVESESGKLPGIDRQAIRKESLKKGKDCEDWSERKMNDSRFTTVLLNVDLA